MQVGVVEFALSEEVMETPASSTPTSGITPPAMRRRANEYDDQEYGERATQSSKRMADSMDRIASAIEEISASTRDTQEMMKKVVSTNQEMLKTVVSTNQEMQKAVTAFSVSLTEAVDSEYNEV
ncbi:hypothetical protein J437_LFUL006530 [Ladona fulva]|uniref:Uncharacterized protein n=1 Tax=Ladona fulva TaxID=123851 RepID=A0A8K0KLW9_LADFU|nr:hypothetical protein J437_LFUL006530 [Ladona fulva]